MDSAEYRTYSLGDVGSAEDWYMLTEARFDLFFSLSVGHVLWAYWRASTLIQQGLCYVLGSSDICLLQQMWLSRLSQRSC